MSLLRRVTLADIPANDRLCLNGSPIHRVFLRRPNGSFVVDEDRNAVARGWALFGWMRNYTREDARD